MPEHREQLDAHVGPVLPEHRGAEPEPVQEDLGRHLRGPQQLLPETATVESRLLPRDHRHVLEGSLGRLSVSHPHQPVLVQVTYRQRRRGVGEGLQAAPQLPLQGLSPADRQSRQVFGSILP